MSAKDVFHNNVKSALQKEGWQISHDPLYINFGGVEMYIDLGAQRLIGAQKDGEKIAVEVKSFLGASTISEFHTAIGQFINYRSALKATEAERVLYLGVPLEIYNTFFQLQFTQIVIQENQVSFLVFDPENEVIVLWER